MARFGSECHSESEEQKNGIMTAERIFVLAGRERYSKNMERFDMIAGCPFDSVAEVVSRGNCLILVPEDFSGTGEKTRVKPGLRFFEGVDGVVYDRLQKTWVLNNFGARCDQCGILWFPNHDSAQKVMDAMSIAYSVAFEDELVGVSGKKSKGYLPEGLTLSAALSYLGLPQKANVFETEASAKPVRHSCIALFPNHRQSLPNHEVFGRLFLRKGNENGNGLFCRFYDTAEDAIAGGKGLAEVGTIVDYPGQAPSKHLPRELFEAVLPSDRSESDAMPSAFGALDPSVPDRTEPYVVVWTDGTKESFDESLDSVRRLLGRKL
jgi:hypothetical protein